MRAYGQLTFETSQHACPRNMSVRSGRWVDQPLCSRGVKLQHKLRQIHIWVDIVLFSTAAGMARQCKNFTDLASSSMTKVSKTKSTH
jgi:hypothetical protein